jgi:hypothetical protein
MNIVKRADLLDGEWDKFVTEHPGGWFWHTSHWIAYSLAYTEGAVDESFVVLDDERIVALVPLVVAGQQRLVYGGQITPAPLIAQGAAARQAADGAYAHSCTIVGRAPFPIQLRPGLVPTGQPPHGARKDIVGTYVVNLRGTDATLWKQVRKSYKSLIHKAEQDYDILAVTARWGVEVARGIHLVESGRETRPAATWSLMADWCEHGHAFVVLAARDRTSVGYAYVIRFKDWAYYASGASTVHNVAHALQWHAITTCKSGGLVTRSATAPRRTRPTRTKASRTSKQASAGRKSRSASFRLRHGGRASDEATDPLSDDGAHRESGALTRNRAASHQPLVPLLAR